MRTFLTARHFFVVLRETKDSGEAATAADLEGVQNDRSR